MKRNLLIVLSVLTLLTLAACAGNAPQTQPEPATATQAPAQPTETSIPPTAAPTDTVAPTVALPTETETAVPATEAQASAGGVSYSNNVYPILQAKCLSCHGVDRIREGLDMRSYAGLINGSNNGPVITPGDANNSLLVQLVAQGEMPTRGTPVTPEELQVIIDWINQGAPNN